MIGARTRVGAHASIEGPTVLGEDNRVFPHAVLGFEPQDLKYRGEKTRLTVGSRNVFREFSTVHRGTVTGHGETVIGDDNLFMSYSHVAHDCRIGSFTVFANSASLAGHVDVGDRACSAPSWEPTSSSGSATTRSSAPMRSCARTRCRSARPKESRRRLSD